MAESKVVGAVVTLTPSESKRVIGKAVARIDVGKRALREGSVAIGLGTTNSFVAEEITGIKVDKAHYCSGIVTPQGLGLTARTRKLDSYLVKGGKISTVGFSEWPKICEQLGAKDVYIKGGNAIDHQRNVAVIAADPAGGSLNQALWKAINERGLNVVIPIGLEKTIPTSLTDLRKKLVDGRIRASKQMGLPICKLHFLPGQVVTEIEAFKILTGAEATAIGSGGIGGGEGSITLLLEGKEENVRNAWDLVNQVKGEAPIRADPENLGKA